MADYITKLEENLRQQAALYGRLAELERRKQQALVKNNLQELDQITVQEEQLLFEAQRLEGERLQWADQIGKSLGKTPEELTLAELAEAHPQLKGVQQELDRVIGELQELHRVNTELLEQAIKVVNATIALLTHEDKSTYDNPQQKAPTGRPLSFWDKSV